MKSFFICSIIGVGRGILLLKECRRIRMCPNPENSGTVEQAAFSKETPRHTMLFRLIQTRSRVRVPLPGGEHIVHSDHSDQTLISHGHRSTLVVNDSSGHRNIIRRLLKAAGSTHRRNDIFFLSLQLPSSDGHICKVLHSVHSPRYDPFPVHCVAT